MADKALKMLDVDAHGLDLMDRKILEAIVHRFDGGPVGLDNVAAAIGEERDTIEDVIEPYLIQQGYLMRTARGRMATAKAYRHLGFKPKAGSAGLSPSFPIFSTLTAAKWVSRSCARSVTTSSPCTWSRKPIATRRHSAMCDSLNALSNDEPR